MADTKQNASTGRTNAEVINNKSGTLIRHRFTVPANDVEVETWVDSQSNLSFSLRMLIKSFISEFGADQDATCLSMSKPVKGVGRPRKADLEAVNVFSGFKKPTTDAGASGEAEPVRPVQIQPVQVQEVTEVEQDAISEETNDSAPEQVNMNDLGL